MLIKTLSLIQPWAQLVVIGAKKWETRSWNTWYRGPILIHASGKKDFPTGAMCNTEPWKTFIHGQLAYNNFAFGAIIGEAFIDYTVGTELVREKLQKESPNELIFGDFKTGRVAWRLSKPIKYKFAYPCKGQLNLWDFDDELLKHCK